MVIKLREANIKRLELNRPRTETEISHEVKEEMDSLRRQVDFHPDAVKFAMEVEMLKGKILPQCRPFKRPFSSIFLTGYDFAKTGLGIEHQESPTAFQIRERLCEMTAEGSPLVCRSSSSYLLAAR